MSTAAACSVPSDSLLSPGLQAWDTGLKTFLGPPNASVTPSTGVIYSSGQCVICVAWERVFAYSTDDCERQPAPFSAHSVYCACRGTRHAVSRGSAGSLSDCILHGSKRYHTSELKYAKKCFMLLSHSRLGHSAYGGGESAPWWHVHSKLTPHGCALSLQAVNIW